MAAISLARPAAEGSRSTTRTPPPRTKADAAGRLQFADKGQIVARDEALRAQTRFSSRREVEHFVQSLQDLRNNLAHSQEICSNWAVIHELATNLHRIVLGPVADAVSVRVAD